MNDNEREQWVNNDEGLYLWWKAERKAMRTFIRQHRQDIDHHINDVRGMAGTGPTEGNEG